MRVEGKTFVVTGGGNGMGRELVLALLAKGARVAAVDISEPGLAETAQRAGVGDGRLSLHEVDITDREAVESLPGQVTAAHGGVDGLVNCAGIIQPFVKFNELDYSAMERVFNVNLWGAIHMTKSFLPHLLDRPEAHILNVSSMGGFVPVPGQTMYGASKAAVKLFTEGLYAELAGTNVGVTVAFPGAVATDISKNSGVDIGADTASADASKFKTLAPSDAARIMLDAVESGAYRVMVGSDAAMLDRLVRLAPKRAADTIQKQMSSLLDT